MPHEADADADAEDAGADGNMVRMEALASSGAVVSILDVCRQD